MYVRGGVVAVPADCDGSGTRTLRRLVSFAEAILICIEKGGWVDRRIVDDVVAVLVDPVAMLICARMDRCVAVVTVFVGRAAVGVGIDVNIDLFDVDWLIGCARKEEGEEHVGA